MRAARDAKDAEQLAAEERERIRREAMNRIRMFEEVIEMKDHTTDNCQSDTKGVNSKPEQKTTQVDAETLRITIVMILVTVLFIASFLPYLSLTVWRAAKGKHEALFLSGTGLVAFKIGSRSFLLNSSLNPWIYGIFNSKFHQFYFGWCCRKK